LLTLELMRAKQDELILALRRCGADASAKQFAPEVDIQLEVAMTIATMEQLMKKRDTGQRLSKNRCRKNAVEKMLGKAVRMLMLENNA